MAKITQDKKYLADLLQSQKVPNKIIKIMIHDVPREHFVPSRLQLNAYENRPLDIGLGQTISQPSLVALMLTLLKINKSHNVLEIGTGSGYNAVLLSKLAKQVTSVEIKKPLADRAKKMISKLLPNISNLQIHVSDGTLGYAKNAPYDRIVATASKKDVIPVNLLRQLKIGGIILIPIKTDYDEFLVKAKKVSADKVVKERLFPVRFVPFIGRAE